MRILISGAGIAGPCLAWWLSHSTHTIVLVEKSRTLLPQGQNIDISGAAITAVRRMGLLDAIRRLNTTERGTAGVDADGTVFASFPIAEGGLSATSQYEILRGDLAGVFYDATRARPGVEYRLGTTVTRVLSNDPSGVTVELSTGERETFDLLVAADGQWSRLRREVFPPEAVQVVDKDMYLAYFTVPREKPDTDFWTCHWGLDRRIVATRPDPHGTTRAMLSKMPSDPAERDLWRGLARQRRAEQQRVVRATFRDAGWQSARLLAAMDTAPDFYFQAVQQIRMRRWSATRVVCLGDAAYAPTPLTGQGATLAILGAYCLAGSLSTLAESRRSSYADLHRALEAYEETFKPHVRRIQDLPSFFPGVAHPRTATQRAVWRGFLAALAWCAQSRWVVAVLGWWFGDAGDAEANNDGFALPVYEGMVGGREGM